MATAVLPERDIATGQRGLHRWELHRAQLARPVRRRRNGYGRVNLKSMFFESAIVVISAPSPAIVIAAPIIIIIPISAAIEAGDLELISLSARQATIAKLRLNQNIFSRQNIADNNRNRRLERGASEFEVRDFNVFDHVL